MLFVKKKIRQLTGDDKMELIRKGEKPVLKENWKDGVLYFTFPSLSAQQNLIHGFSSRLGGVSENEFAQMNLSFSRGDKEARVQENYRRIASAIGFEKERIVCSVQTHTTNVREVTEKDCGKGVIRDRDYTDVDGLITNVPGVILATFYADCVPLYFVDPVHRAVGLSHSGWKRTVNNISGETVKKMTERYGTDPADIIAAIGPSICQDCYEVSEDVIIQFKKNYEEQNWPSLYYDKGCNEAGERKYQLNLWEACRLNMLKSGILEEHIEVTDLCTCCNPDILFSHRASQGKRGNLAAFLGLCEIVDEKK